MKLTKDSERNANFKLELQCNSFTVSILHENEANNVIEKTTNLRGNMLTADVWLWVPLQMEMVVVCVFS